MVACYRHGVPRMISVRGGKASHTRESDCTQRHHISSVIVRRSSSKGLPVQLQILLLPSCTPLSTYRSPTLLSPPNSRTTPSRHIHKDPDDEASAEAKRKKEGEAFPVVARLVDDGLNDVGADHGRGAVGEAEETEELGVRVSVC